eukprot:7117029-Pyramimonas_sp.AAC.1
MAVCSTESHSMASVSDEGCAEGESLVDPISVPGQGAVFASGQRRGLSYGRVLRGAPDYVDCGRKVQEPSEDL